MESIRSSLSSLQPAGGSGVKVAEMSAMLFGSKSTYTSTRRLAKLAVDWLAFAKFKQLPRQEKGKVKSDLGEEFMDAFGKGQDIVLLNVHYCQQTLSALMSKTPVGGASTAVSESELQNIKTMSSLINHDYLIVEIQLGVMTMFIKAEKASDPKPGGIFLTEVPPENISEELHQGVNLYTVDCKSKLMPAKDLWDVLKKESPRYCLRDANCWDYAFATTKHLLKRCGEVPGLSAAEKDRLLWEHDELNKNIATCHIRNNVKKLLDFFGNLIPSS